MKQTLSQMPFSGPPRGPLKVFRIVLASSGRQISQAMQILGVSEENQICQIGILDLNAWIYMPPSASDARLPNCTFSISES